MRTDRRADRQTDRQTDELMRCGLFHWKVGENNSSVRLSVRLSVTMFDQIFCTNYYGCFVLWSLSKPQFWKTEWCVWAFLLRMENGFVPRAEGPWFLFRIPIRNVPFPIRYICVRRTNEGRNLTFVPRAEGPWFVGAGRRLFVDICTIESGRDPTNYY